MVLGIRATWVNILGKHWFWSNMCTKSSNKGASPARFVQKGGTLLRLVFTRLGRV